MLLTIAIKEMEEDGPQAWATAGPDGKADQVVEASNPQRIRELPWPNLLNSMRKTLSFRMLSMWRPIWSRQTNPPGWRCRSKTRIQWLKWWRDNQIMVVELRILTILGSKVDAMCPDAEWLIDSTVNWLCEHWPVTNYRTVFSTLIAKISTSMSMRPIITKNWSLRIWDMTSILTGQDPHLTILYHAKASKSHVHQLHPHNKSKHLSTRKRKKKLY